LQTQSEGVYRDGKPFLEQSDYNEICRELKDKLLSAELEIRLALVYGKDSQEVVLFNTLQKKLMEVTLMLWDAKKETWDTTEHKIMSIFSQTIDPMRNQFKEILLKKSSSRTFLSNL